jgi:NTP pyrophosphatase (non-canonical NTP hydrolase)
VAQTSYGEADVLVTPSDATTPIATMKTAMQQFVVERSWEQFHSPKNLAMSLAIEAAELMEHVQWLDTQASRELKQDPVRKAAMGEEIADVFSYLLALCNALDLDLTSTTLAKMLKNQQKYPAEAFRGRYGCDDPNPPAR